MTRLIRVASMSLLHHT